MFIFIFLGYVYISIMIRGVRDLLGVVDVAGLEVELEWNSNSLGLEFI
jgi:hypothetical protein